MTARAGIGVAAVVAAVAGTGLAPAPAPRPAAPSAATSSSTAPTPVHHDGTAPLLQLAAAVQRAPLPAGDAWLIRRSEYFQNPPYVSYDLYTDTGKYYWSQTESGLPAALASGADASLGADATLAAAAAEAAGGDVAGAVQRLLTWAGPNLPPTEADNRVWVTCTTSLPSVAYSPTLRAGVLRILAQLPGVQVTRTRTAGQPTLSLTAGPQEFGGLALQEDFVIDATTGMPVADLQGKPGGRLALVTSYQVSRVTLAAVAAGRVGS